MRSYDGGKRIKGCKRHIVTDTLVLLLVVVVHSAGIHDCKSAGGCFNQIKDGLFYNGQVFC
ncbi:MAG: transposase [Bacteroidales bacterium]|nr:transposase [Bacteroidales bacterium]